MFTRASTSEPTTIAAVRMTLNGQPVIATAIDATAIVAHDADRVRCSITSRDASKRINIITEPDDAQLTWLADERTRAAASRPPALRSERPSARTAAVRRTAREYHAATWNHGYAQGQADSAGLPIADRVRPDEVPELMDLLMRSVLGDAALREQLRAALDAAEIEMAIAPSVPEWIAQRQAS